MGSEALLRLACEKAFAVARAGYEADPSIDPPGAMRGFLYAGRLPRRAMTAAQRSLERDDAFRSRVAQDTTVEEVGEAGYVWLHRPDGWLATFERLKVESEGPEVKQAVGASGSVSRRQTPTIPPPPGFEPSDFGEESVTTNGSHVPDPGSEVKEVEDEMGDVNAIEHELSSLRGLVDRLANERQGVTDEAQAPISFSGLSPKQNEVKIDTEAMDHLKTKLEEAYRERDDARQKHSDSLTHQLELEKELSRLRSSQSDIDGAKAESDGRLVEARKELARVAANREEAERQREATIDQMTSLNNEINRLKGDLKSGSAVRSQLEAKMSELAAETKASHEEVEQAGVRAQRLVVTNEEMSRRIVEGEQEIERLRVELDGFADLARRADTLQVEAEELTVELQQKDARSHELQNLVKSHDGEILLLNAALRELQSDRDQLANQVVLLQQSLGEALTDLGDVRISRDLDREKTQAFRSERDDLKVELARLQEIDNKQSAKLDELLGEQSAHVAQRQRSEELEEQVLSLDAELNNVKGDLSRVVAERDVASEELVARSDEFEMLQADVQTLSGRAESSAAALERAEGSLEEIRLERETLATQLSVSEQETKAAEEQAIKSQQQLEEALSNLGAIQQEISSQQLEIESVKSSLAEESERAKEYRVAADTRQMALDNYDSESNAAVEEIAALKAELSEQKEEAASLAASARDAHNSAEKLNVELETVRSELESVKAQAAERSRVLEDEIPAVGTPPLPLGKASSASETKRSVPPEPTLQAIREQEPQQDEAIEPEVADIDEVVDTPDDPPAPSGIAALIRSVPDSGDGEATDALSAVPDTSARRPPSMLEEEGGEVEVTGSGDDDLDALSNLISQKVTGFTGVTEDENEPETGPDNITFFGDRVTPSEESGIGRPPSVFSSNDAGPNSSDSDTTLQPPSDMPISAMPPVAPPVDDSPASVSSQRQMVEIPEDIASRGGVDLARFVVESPEIVLLVDGDGVAKMGWSSRSVAEQREALVSWLADLTASTGASSDVVFDGRIGGDGALPSSRVVSIRLSTPPTEPVAALDELVDAYPPQFPIALVTDDIGLQESSLGRGAVALSNAQLLDLFTPE